MRCMEGRICRLCRHEARGLDVSAKRVCLFHEQTHFTTYDLHVVHDRNVRSLAHRWYTISNSVMKFCGAITQMGRR